MKVYTIYIATNTTNGKKYVGFDSAWPRRKHSHKREAFNSNSHTYKTLFHNAIRKHGWENFNWTPIYQSLDKQHTLSTMETYFINLYRTFVGFEDCVGYNLTQGGEGQKNRPMSEETKRKKSIALRGRLSQQSKRVHTPFGVFDSLTHAARSLNLHIRTIIERLQRHTFIDWYYVDTCIKKTGEYQLGSARQISTPFGVFDSINECHRITKIPTSTIQSRLTSDVQLEWKYTGVTHKLGTVAIHTPFGVFDSISEAAKVLNMSKSTITAKLRSKRMTDWYRK